MGRNIIVALFLLILGAAIALFVGRKPEMEQLPLGSVDHAKAPRILLEDFTLYEYEGSQTKASLSGRFASFHDPHTLEMLGNLQGQRYNLQRRESFAAESATIQFAANSLVDLMRNSRPQTTIIENQVRIGYGDVKLYTDFARYLHEEERLLSDLPVRIEGPRASLRGSKGFEYDSKTRDLKVFGPLEGTLRGMDQE